MNPWLLLQRYYRCHLEQLTPELASSWRGLNPDRETRDFLAESRRKSDNVCLQLFYAVVYTVLCVFVSLTDINGLLGRGRMFVFSMEHIRSLLPPSFPPPSLVLDVGSGDGHVTDKLRTCLGPEVTIHVTEASSVMRRVLGKKGYKVLDMETWHRQSNLYDIISCLNVLDRCDRPLSMLREFHSQLRDGGLLILAVVLPFKPFVEKGARQTQPSECLPVRGGKWEEGVCDLVSEVLQPLGFSLMSLSKLPYLCEGDLHSDFFALQDAILVLSKDKVHVPS
jgi:SAM-dependent methyltransferase